VSVSACDAQRFHAWQGRPASARRQRDGRLKVLIRASFAASNQSYGSPRIHRDLHEDHDESVSRKRVIRLMQEEGLKAGVPKRFVCTTNSDHHLPVAPNLLNRQFTAEAPNQRWVGGTTEFKIRESGKLYLDYRSPGGARHHLQHEPDRRLL
jgi:transposase InsO family protein